MKRWIKASEEYENNLGEACINAWEYALDQAGLQEEDIHVLSYDEIKTFEKILERELKNRHVDLSYKSAVIPQEGRGSQIEGLKIGGNVGAVADNLIRGVTKKAWHAVSKEENVETIEFANDSGMEIYTQDKYGYCVPSNAQKALKLVGAGDYTQYAGHGSQQYIDDTKVTVYEDDFGNVKVARTTLRYD